LLLVKGMKVLVIGRSRDLAEAIPPILKVRWPDLDWTHAREASESLELIHGECPDIVMYHLPERSEGAPPPDYFDLISQIRSFSDVPLIVIGQTDDVMDKVKALETGADDWMSPDFVPMEFIARVNGILRRCSPRNHPKSYFLGGKLAIDYATREVFIFDKKVKLTPIQYKLLCHLVQNEGRVCSSAELLRHVWGPSYGDDKELLKLGVYRLRSRIEEDPSNPEIILSERGIGYVVRASGPGSYGHLSQTQNSMHQIPNKSLYLNSDMSSPP
jgi:two-component system KDP operon response regulator KdpE